MDRYFTDPDLLGRVPGLLLILGGIYLGMGMVACLLINQPPEDWIQRYTTIQPTTRGLIHRYTIIQPTTRGLDTQVHNLTTNHQRTGYRGTQLYNQPPEDWIHRYAILQPTTRGLDTGTQSYNQPPEDWIHRYTTIQPTTRGLDTQGHNHTTNHQRTGYTGTPPYNQPPEDWIHYSTQVHK